MTKMRFLFPIKTISKALCVERMFIKRKLSFRIKPPSDQFGKVHPPWAK